MATPYLVPCLVKLRDQFNHEFPDRAKGADGWIGDAAHQSGTSDHNPNAQGAVRAVDITTDLARPGVSLWDVCEMVRGDSRLEYIIHMGKIASRSQGWTWRAYTGSSDPHTNHAHFSARHDGTGWTSTGPWGLEDIVTKSEFMSWMTEWSKSTAGVAYSAAVLDAPVANSVATGRRVRNLLADLEDARNIGRLPADNAEVKAAGYPAGSPLVQLLAVPAKLTALEAKVNAMAKPPAA